MTGACDCRRKHYPLRFFERAGLVLATRGTKPVENVIADGWEPCEPSEAVRRQLAFQYDLSHRFDWLHTPTYLDDKDAHLRMKAQTAGWPLNDAWSRRA